MAPRAGFIIKNAADAVSLTDEAEPDALDFNLLGNHRYGVLSGCDVTMGGGGSVSVANGVAVVNGAIMRTGGTVTLPFAGSTARFDLIGVDSAGHVIYVRGSASPNPVFPEYGDDVTILAAVLMQPGVTPTQANVTDKRVFLPERYRTALDVGVLLGSYQVSNLASRFEIDYSGLHRWMSGALLWESSPLTISVHENINVEGVTSTDDLLVAGDATVGGNVSSDNLQRGSGPPVGSGTPGDLYQNTTGGGIWTWAGGAWQQLSTVPFAVGFVAAMMRDDEPAGWLLINGQQVQSSRAGGLWALHPEWIVGTTAGPMLQLPDYSQRYLRGGPVGATGGSATITLREEHLPPHKHLPTSTGTTDPAGNHIHGITIDPVPHHGHITNPGGAHAHTVHDPGHQHVGAWPGGAIIAQVWNGPWRLDGPFNDASHPTAVGAISGINYAQTNISIGGDGDHSHTTDLDGAHTHVATITPTGSDHVHPIDERSVGGGAAFDNNPPYGCVNWFIKT